MTDIEHLVHQFLLNNKKGLKEEELDIQGFPETTRNVLYRMYSGRINYMGALEELEELVNEQY